MNGRRLSVRDYKGSRRGGLALDNSWWRPFTLGLVLGLALAAAFFIVMHRHALPAAAPGRTALSAPTGDAPDLARTAGRHRAAESGHSVAASSGVLAASAGTPADGAPAKGATANGAGANGAPASSLSGTAGGAAPSTGLPRYDFYQMLTRSQVLVPGHESDARAPAGGVIARPGVYFLQIGSYRDANVADRVCAEAEKLGVSASVQRIVVDAATWHRVRVGPIRDLALLNRVRHQLQAGNLAAMVVRVNP